MHKSQINNEKIELEERLLIMILLNDMLGIFFSSLNSVES